MGLPCFLYSPTHFLAFFCFAYLIFIVLCVLLFSVSHVLLSSFFSLFCLNVFCCVFVFLVSKFFNWLYCVLLFSVFSVCVHDTPGARLFCVLCCGVLYLYQSQGAMVGDGEVIMMAKFYGFDNLYGIGTRDSDNNRIGTVMVFSTREARNNWIHNDLLRNCDYHYESITAKEARREMSRVAYDDLLNRHIVWERADVKHVSMDTIIRAYCRAIL